MKNCDYCDHPLSQPGFMAPKGVQFEHVKGGPEHYTHWSCWDAFVRHGCKMHDVAKGFQEIEAKLKEIEERLDG